MEDRYGNAHSTRSPEAFDHYCAALDQLLAAQPGGIEHLQQAVRTDDGYAVAHADLARALQIVGRPEEAGAAIAHARERMIGLTERERAHVTIMGHLVDGAGTLAFELINEHIQSFPRDVLAVQPCTGVFGLIGFSGRTGREAENLAFMTALARHYSGDWWFESQYAFACSEVGQLQRAERLIDRAFNAHSANANAAHHRAHIHYEAGETAAGRKAVAEWRQDYDRAGLLHCHLAWHEAVWALEQGDQDRVWEIVRSDVLPDNTLAPPINAMTDLVAILLRSEMAGVPRQPDLWQLVSDYAEARFPKPGLSFADAHSAIAYALAGNHQALANLQSEPGGPAGDLVAFIARAFAAYAAADWQLVVDRLVPVMASHERLGGSRAQRDLFELAYGHALTQLGYAGEAGRMRLTRRPCLGPLSGG